MEHQRICIVGGGIGGLATAIAIRQEGFDVTVLEQQDSLHNSVFGVGIIQPINALRALDAIGAAQPCIDAGYPAEAWGRCTTSTATSCATSTAPRSRARICPR